MSDNKIDISKKSAAVMITLLMVIGIAISIAVVISAGLIPGVGNYGTRQDFELEQVKQSVVEGAILDRNGEIIVKSTEPGISNSGDIQHSLAYSPIIGYSSATYKSSGIRNAFDDMLYDGGKDNIGATINLTLDTSLQQTCYDLLGNNVGAIVVLNAKTGEILSMVSRGSKTEEYDANLIYEKHDEYDKYDGLYYNYAVTSHKPPGSTFKMITAVSMIDNGIEQAFHDTGTANYAKPIRNAKGRKYGDVDLQTALKYSINTYFATKGVELGKVRLENTASAFMLGKPFYVDFMRNVPVESTLDIKGNDGNIAQTAYGQGLTQMSPLHMAMCMEAIMNDGQMHTPYMISSIDNDGDISYNENHFSNLSVVTSADTARKMQKLLHGVTLTDSYNMPEDEYGYVMAKTGTAELDDKGKYYNKYIVVGVKYEDSEYAFCISIESVTNPDYDLKGKSRQIVKQLISSEY